MKRLTLICASLIFCLSLTSCNSTPTAPKPSSSAKRYEIKGKVVSADKANHKVTIEHEEIPGYMEAMTMPFTLYDDWVYSELTPGASIQATLVVDGEKSWLENPVVTKIADPSLVGKNAETVAEPILGAAAPNFTLTNQDGKKISFNKYRGRTLILTFIYTRCPLPDYCPLMSRNFAQINQELQKNSALKVKTHLLSITVDPEYDKPKILREYGTHYIGSNQSGLNQWEFATGSTDEIKKVAQFFGLNYWPEKDQIIHALRTAIISPDGKVLKVYRGNDWKPDDVLRNIEKLYHSREMASN